VHLPVPQMQWSVCVAAIVGIGSMLTIITTHKIMLKSFVFISITFFVI
jgi:hypothetical protein